MTKSLLVIPPSFEDSPLQFSDYRDVPWDLVLGLPEREFDVRMGLARAMTELLTPYKVHLLTFNRVPEEMTQDMGRALMLAAREQLYQLSFDHTVVLRNWPTVEVRPVDGLYNVSVRMRYALEPKRTA